MIAQRISKDTALDLLYGLAAAQHGHLDWSIYGAKGVDASWKADVWRAIESADSYAAEERLPRRFGMREAEQEVARFIGAIGEAMLRAGVEVEVAALWGEGGESVIVTVEFR